LLKNRFFGKSDAFGILIAKKEIAIHKFLRCNKGMFSGKFEKLRGDLHGS
jgi:hypothetical protein